MAGDKLVVGVYLIVLTRTVEVPLRSIDAGVCDGCAEIFKVDPVGLQRRWIRLNTDGWLLTAADAH
jgi:hypothetical protein